MSWGEVEQRSGCPISTTLELVGDRWTLIVLRDLINGKARFSELLDSPEGITPSVLSARLERMTKNGLVTRAPYCQRPVRYAYQLTEKGLSLHPVLVAMCQWANVHYPDTWVAPDSFMADQVG